MQTFILTVDLPFFIWHMVTIIMINSMVAMTIVINTARTIIRVVSLSLLPVDVELLDGMGPRVTSSSLLPVDVELLDGMGPRVTSSSLLPVDVEALDGTEPVVEGNQTISD